MCDNKRCIICDTTFNDMDTSVCPYCGEEDPIYHEDFDDCYEDEEDYEEDYDNDEY